MDTDKDGFLSAVYGAVAVVVAAGITYLGTRYRGDQLDAARTRRLEIEEQKVELAAERAATAQQAALLAAYRDMLADKQQTIDYIYKDIRALRAELDHVRQQAAQQQEALRAELRAIQTTYELELQATRQAHERAINENDILRDRVAELEREVVVLKAQVAATFIPSSLIPEHRGPG